MTQYTNIGPGPEDDDPPPDDSLGEREGKQTYCNEVGPDDDDPPKPPPPTK